MPSVLAVAVSSSVWTPEVFHARIDCYFEGNRGQYGAEVYRLQPASDLNLTV
jgi:hypothetical protein